MKKKQMSLNIKNLQRKGILLFLIGMVIIVFSGLVRDWVAIGNNIIQKKFINILDISLSRCIMKLVMREAAADRSRARIRREPGV